MIKRREQAPALLVLCDSFRESFLQTLFFYAILLLSIILGGFYEIQYQTNRCLVGTSFDTASFYDVVYGQYR